jgi:hypothetical protein
VAAIRTSGRRGPITMPGPVALAGQRRTSMRGGHARHGPRSSLG